jgi:hypothetical protein
MLDVLQADIVAPADDRLARLVREGVVRPARDAAPGALFSSWPPGAKKGDPLGPTADLARERAIRR